MPNPPTTLAAASYGLPPLGPVRGSPEIHGVPVVVLADWAWIVEIDEDRTEAPGCACTSPTRPRDTT